MRLYFLAGIQFLHAISTNILRLWRQSISYKYSQNLEKLLRNPIVEGVFD